MLHVHTSFSLVYHLWTIVLLNTHEQPRPMQLVILQQRLWDKTASYTMGLTGLAMCFLSFRPGVHVQQLHAGVFLLPLCVEAPVTFQSATDQSMLFGHSHNTFNVSISVVTQVVFGLQFHAVEIRCRGPSWSHILKQVMTGLKTFPSGQVHLLRGGLGLTHSVPWIGQGCKINSQSPVCDVFWSNMIQGF